MKKGYIFSGVGIMILVVLCASFYLLGTKNKDSNNQTSSYKQEKKTIKISLQIMELMNPLEMKSYIRQLK